jgi:hypothetical protein
MRLHGFLSSGGNARGAPSLSRNSASTDGDPYERLFADLAFVNPKDRSGKEISETDLIATLARIAEARRGPKDAAPPDPTVDDEDDKPEDAAEPAEIPAGYTYLGQFIIHDLTRSQFPVKGDAPINRVTARLDLDTVYGGGPSLCPHFYQRATKAADSPCLFLLGRTADAKQPQNAAVQGNQPLDLPRIKAGTPGIYETGDDKAIIPLIPDIRNDENLVISQLHGLFVRVHNRVAAHLSKARKLDGRDSFRRAQTFVAECYRQIVVHDYLKRLLPKEYHDELIADSPKLIPNDTGPLFLEFAFSAARVCHAMSRQHYVVNTHINPELSGLNDLLQFSSHRLDAPLPLPADWVINWENFFEMPGAAPPQSARRLTPLLSPVLVDAATTLSDPAPRDSVSFRDLWRCYEQQLPTGQACAQFLTGRIEKLSKGDKLGKAARARRAQPRPLKSSRIAPDNHLKVSLFVEPLAEALSDAANEWFLTETPLTYYLAQEAYLHGNAGRTFGPLGAYIVASTFRRALNATGGKTGHFKTPKGVSTMPQFIGLLALSDKALAEQIDATMAGVSGQV